MDLVQYPITVMPPQLYVVTATLKNMLTTQGVRTRYLISHDIWFIFIT
jgi:hypothetical protein